MRFFNTAGPVQPEIHYHVPSLTRLDVDDLLLFMRQRKYFVLHAPRQTGKTSALLALRDELNAAGDFRCVYVNVEVGQSAREDVAAAMRAILSALASEARYALDDRFLDDAWPAVLRDAGPHDALRETLARWSGSDAKPLVLLIDEIDALLGREAVSSRRNRRRRARHGLGDVTSRPFRRVGSEAIYVLLEPPGPAATGSGPEATSRFRRASTRAANPSIVRAPSRRRSPGRANTTSSTVSKPPLRRNA